MQTEIEFQEVIKNINNNLIDSITLDTDANWLRLNQVLKALENEAQLSVKTLDLSPYPHGFTRDGGLQIAHMLEKNQSLEKLTIKGHYIGSQGIIAIAKAAGSHPHLKALCLDQCDLDCIGYNPYDEGPPNVNGMDALKALEVALQKSISLEHISVQSCTVDSGTKLGSEAFLSKAQGITSLSFIRKTIPSSMTQTAITPLLANSQGAQQQSHRRNQNALRRPARPPFQCHII